MARSKKDEARYLDKDERALVDNSHAPALCALSQDDLIGLARRLRDRRDRAQDISRDRRRTARGSGSEAAADVGIQHKKGLLAAAVKRVNRELERRRGSERRALKGSHQANLRAALRRKRASPQWRGPEDRTAHDGMNALPNTKIAPSGALHAEGSRAAMHRSTGDR